jgi:hypothetical protein
MQSSTSASLYHGLTISGLSLVEIALILLVALPLALFLGFAAGRAHRKRSNDDKTIDRVAGETTLNAFLTLFALLLAFAFGNALSTSQAIKGAITDEAAALGTAFLRADYLAEPGRTELQRALLDYARTRVVPKRELIGTPERVHAFLDTTLAAQVKLWPLTLQATSAPTPPPIQSFVGGAMNAVLDAHLYRIATLSVPIAAFTQAMVLASAVAALVLLGNRAGMRGHSLTWRSFAFVLFLCVLMYTIVDIRRGSEGLILVDDNVLLATIFDMEQALADRP